MSRETAKIIYKLLKEISYGRELTSREEGLLRNCKKQMR
jgi:hypothetical protein